MANSRDGRTVDGLVADFGARIEELRREGVPSYPPLGGKLPWAEATETRKLAEIIWESWSVRLGEGAFDPGAAGFQVIAVPGAAALAAIERNVDYARLPVVQREMLQDVRVRLDAGQFDGPDPNNRDLAAMALARIVGVGEFEEKLEAHKQDGRWPWAWVREDRKAGMIVELGLESGTPGTHTLAAIEREVDYDELRPWRREALQDVRRRQDRGELDGEHPHPSYLGDRTDFALRLAQFETHVEDFKQLGARDDRDIPRRWQELNEGERFDRIMDEAIGLKLDSESRAYEILAREVDMTRTPGEHPQLFEDGRKEAWPGPEESARTEQRLSPGELATSNPTPQQQHNNGQRQGQQHKPGYRL